MQEESLRNSEFLQLNMVLVDKFLSFFLFFPLSVYELWFHSITFFLGKKKYYIKDILDLLNSTQVYTRHIIKFWCKIQILYPVTISIMQQFFLRLVWKDGGGWGGKETQTII